MAHLLGTALGRTRDAVLAVDSAYRLWLRTSAGAAFNPRGSLDVPSWCATLQSEEEWRAAVADSRRLGLPLHPHGPKNWDTRIIVAALLASTGDDDPILDAVAETYSTILGTLYLYGRRKLTGINLTFDRPVRRGPIRFEYGDITKTRFAEMARLLRPDGVLVTSTDYSPEPVDTRGQVAYGALRKSP
jgi:hypothetical protein